MVQIDKKEFVKYFEYENQMLLSSLYEKLDLCLKADIDVYSEEFYPPNIWAKLEKMQHIIGADVESEGFFENSERRMVLFKTREYESYGTEFPMKVLRISNKSKFKDLEHRHFLGTIMSLGIKREKLGDIVVEDVVAYAPIYEDLADYVKKNLDTIAKNPVDIEVLGYKKCEVPEYRFSQESILVSSLRLDALVSSLCKVSRNEAVKLIEGRRVSLNYIIEVGKNTQVSEGDLLSIRKHGKYVFQKINGISKKGKIRLNIKQFL